MGHEAFGVDLAALSQAEQGVRDAVAELGEMGGGYSAADGQGLVEGIGSEAGSVGHEGLAEALTTFAGKWRWGVRHLVDDGVSTADALSDTRAWYQKVDDEAIGMLKQGLHTVIGDPEDQASEWRDKSWSEIGSEAAPDYSVSAFQESAQKRLDGMEQMTGSDLDGNGTAGGGR